MSFHQPSINLLHRSISRAEDKERHQSLSRADEEHQGSPKENHIRRWEQESQQKERKGRVEIAPPPSIPPSILRHVNSSSSPSLLSLTTAPLKVPVVPDWNCHKALSPNRLNARTSGIRTHPPEPLSRLHPGGLPVEAQRRPHGVIEHHPGSCYWLDLTWAEPDLGWTCSSCSPASRRLLSHCCFCSLAHSHSALFNRQWPRPQPSNDFPTMAHKHKHSGGGGGGGPGRAGPASLSGSTLAVLMDVSLGAAGNSTPPKLQLHNTQPGRSG